jgi:hypothetical protein
MTQNIEQQVKVLPKQKGEIAKENGETNFRRPAKVTEKKEKKEKKPKAPKKKRARKEDSTYQSHDERISNVKNDSFIRIEGWMPNNLMITGVDLMVFALIHKFTETKGNFHGSQTHIADWINMSTNTVRAIIDRLLELEYIEKKSVRDGINNYPMYRSRILWDKNKELVKVTQKIWDSENKDSADETQKNCDNKKEIPKVTKDVEKKVERKVCEGVSPKAEDTPSASEMEELKKQMAEVQKMLANSIEMNKQREKEERERERREIEQRFEEEKRRLKEEKIAEQKRYEQEVEERFQQRLKEQTEKQGQNLVEKTDKTKPSPLGTKDDKVKGEKEQGQEPMDVTDTFEYNEEGLNAVFGGFEFKQPTESAREEEKEADIYKDVEDWFLN